MSQAGPYMRKIAGGYAHYCPACEGMHHLPDRWQFNGNLDSPTFTPSFRQQPSDPEQECHYVITNGRIFWHGGSWHKREGSQPMVMLSTVDYASDPLLLGEDNAT